MLMDNRKNKTAVPSFGTFTEALIEQLRAQGRYSTADKYLSSLRSISKFLRQQGKTSLRMDEVNSSLVVDYNVWMKSTGMVMNTVSFYNRIFRSIYHQAVNEYGLDDNCPFKSVFTGVAKTRKRAASGREIARIIVSETGGKARLDLARDLFAFSYFMRGMAFVDMVYLRKSDIRGGYICYERHKTGTCMMVRLEPEAGRIITKYAGQTEGSRYVFPILGQSEGEEAYKKYRSALSVNNRLLKSFQNNMSLVLTYYVSRHSWASNAHSLDIPLGVISESLGHTNERTTEIYLRHLETGRLDRANRKVMGGIKKLLSTVESNLVRKGYHYF